MTTLIRPACEKRFLLALLIVGVLAYLFWTGSRYPALNEKAMMSGAIQLDDPLSFEAKYQLTEAMGTLERTFWTTLNWINTNRKGMTFGILFAAAFMTAVSFLQRRALAGGFSNAALGMALGAPLGVCANCAAPIGKGVYASGMRAETTLAAMVASPTLNIVVLTMLFSLVPVWMAVSKLVLSFAVILVAVPLALGSHGAGGQGMTGTPQDFDRGPFHGCIRGRSAHSGRALSCRHACRRVCPARFRHAVRTRSGERG